MITLNFNKKASTRPLSIKRGGPTQKNMKISHGIQAKKERAKTPNSKEINSDINHLMDSLKIEN